MTSTNEVDASSLQASGGGGDGEEAVCYLCLDGGADEQLRRDCACRGTDAGFVHLSCLTDYLATKSIRASDMTEFVKPWRECPGCHQYYRNELAIDIAAKFVPFVRRQYPQDTQRQVESHHLKLDALCSMFERLQPRQKREYGVTANVLLSLIDRMKVDARPLSVRYFQLEADATIPMVGLLLMRGQKRVQGGR
jgi:hypothetical protein